MIFTPDWKESQLSLHVRCKILQPLLVGVQGDDGCRQRDVDGCRDGLVVVIEDCMDYSIVVSRLRSVGHVLVVLSLLIDCADVSQPKVKVMGKKLTDERVVGLDERRRVVSHED